mgnify:CR=1 FL=1
MKFWGGFLTQILNIFVIVQSEGVDTVITDFIAFGIIAEIDDMIAMTIKDFNPGDLIFESNNKLHFEKDAIDLNEISKKEFENWTGSKFSLYFRKMYYAFFSFQRLAYEIFHFYFTPYLCLILVLAFGSDPADKEKYNF